ncbi:MAG: carboxypeptidase-like regulatory domain-containing protein, partial [Bacteroidota bacterium]
MRFLLGLFLLFFSWSLAAQCSIQVDIASVECVDGQGVWISFDVEGTGDSAWILREYDQIGGYFTDEIITIGPVQGTSGDTIVLFFEDLTDPENCFLSVPVLVPENCGTTDPCFGFVADVVIDGSGGCGDLENATAFFVGGVGPYAYELSLGNQVLAQDSAYLEDSLTFVNLAAGTYLLAVIDDRNCTTNTRFSVRGAAGLDVNIVPSGDFCAASGEEFTLSAAVANGTPPFTYVWQDGSTTAGVVVPLDFDLTYSVTVADANGCTGTDIWFPDSLINTINWFTPFVLPCDGGSVTISTGDSTDQYEYTWTTPSGNVLFGPTIEATEVGNYFVTGSVAGSRCSVRGVATVISGVLPPAEDISIRADIFEDSLFCGIARCFEVVLPNNVNTRDFRYYWQDADGNPVIDSDRRHIACLETAGVYTVTVASACDSVTLSIVVTNEECGVLSGTVYVDQAGNCSLDAGDDIPAGRVVVLVVADSGEEYYTITDADGAYYIDVPQGTYTLRPITQPDQPFGACEPPLTVTVGSSPTEGADLFLPALLDCPNLTTSVSLPFLRRCFRNFAYVDYRNHGSATAEDATLTVTLDDFFIDVVPSINPTTVDGNTYTFDLGDVPPFAGGQINFLFTVSCEARLGQSHCLESKVTPDAPCNPEENWNGAMVNITEADCNGEEVAFTITNVGDNPMSVPLSYVVVEDGVMMTPQPIESDALNPGANIQVTLPADGTTYQLITNQEPDAPAAEEPTALSEGCGTNPAGTFTTGLANLLALGNGASESGGVRRGHAPGNCGGGDAPR